MKAIRGKDKGVEIGELCNHFLRFLVSTKTSRYNFYVGNLLQKTVYLFTLSSNNNYILVPMEHNTITICLQTFRVTFDSVRVTSYLQRHRKLFYFYFSNFKSMPLFNIHKKKH